LKTKYFVPKEKILEPGFLAILRIFTINHGETFRFLGLKHPVLQALLSPFLILPGVYFTQTLVRINRRAGVEGFVPAMIWGLHRYYSPTEIHWSSNGSPGRVGPLLVVGNHPGLGDFPALLEALGRTDVRVIVKERELMTDLRHIIDRCIVIDESLSSKARAITEAVNYMSSGGVVVIFPAGEIEEDPALVTWDGESILKPWFPIVDGIARRCLKVGFDFAVLPTLVDRVYSVPPGLGSYVGSSKDASIRSGRAAIITMVTGIFRKTSIRVRFARFLPSAEILSGNTKGELTEEVRQRLKEFKEDL